MEERMKSKKKEKTSAKKVQPKMAAKKTMISKKVSTKAVKASSKAPARPNKSAKKATMSSKSKEAPIKSGIPQKRMAQQPAASKQDREQSSEDIIQLCLKDHVALKELIEVMKDNEAEDHIKEEAFEKFAKLLKRHAKPEEQTLYVRMKEDEDLRADSFEGDTEHAIADQLIKEINAAKDDDVWCAKVKVLAELVEHHIEEEEEDMFPECEEAIKASERTQLGNQYLLLQTQYDNPDEEMPEKFSADAEQEESDEYEHKDAEIIAEEESEDDSDDSPTHHA